MGTMYLKILGTGEIVKWKDFSEITQLYVVESANGKITKIQSNKVSKQVMVGEVAEFEQAKTAGMS